MSSLPVDEVIAFANREQYNRQLRGDQMDNRVQRIQLVRRAGGWKNYTINIWRGTTGTMRSYRYTWGRMCVILACLKYPLWVGSITPQCDEYNRMERVD